MAMTHRRTGKARPPLDETSLAETALCYAGRYATSRAKLAAYLKRKLRERGWDGAGAPDLDGLLAKMVDLGYVNDQAFASARAGALGRKGYGIRRVDAALRAAGIEAGDAEAALGAAEGGAWAAATRFAERRRIGPFAEEKADRPARERAFAAMIRAGHPPAIARRFVEAPPGEVPDADTI
jgi:regulatory protein